MKEGELINRDQLRDEWTRVLSTYDLFIDGGHKLRPIRFIVRHIIERGYDRYLFPGTSMYSLLISIPHDSKVNFNKTLRIEFDHLTETLKFRFKDRTNESSKWEETCQATEGSDLLDSLFADKEDFRLLTKEN